MKTGPPGVRDPRGILDALAVALGGEVEAAEAVAREGVRPALEYHRPGLVGPARAYKRGVGGSGTLPKPPPEESSLELGHSHQPFSSPVPLWHGPPLPWGRGVGGDGYTGNPPKLQLSRKQKCLRK